MKSGRRVLVELISHPSSAAEHCGLLEFNGRVLGEYSMGYRQVTFGTSGRCSVASTSNVYVMGRNRYMNYESVSVVKQRTIVIKSAKGSKCPSVYESYTLNLISYVQRLGGSASIHLRPFVGVRRAVACVNDRLREVAV